MDITGILKHDKERILNEDSAYIYKSQNISTIRAKRSDLCSLIGAVVSILACIVACLCAVFCYTVLQEIRANTNTFDKVRISASGANGISGIYDDNDKLEDYNNAFYDSDTDDYKIGDFEDVNISQLSNGQSQFDVKKETRVRRATDKQIKACKKNCKGTRREKKICRRACKKNASTNIQGIKINSLINLPAAHFEANMRDVQTQVRADTQYNEPKKEDEGPLNIFKQADWVKDSSPVHFSKSVATAKSAGIFLVYAQAYIGGAEPEKSITVVVKRQGEDVNALSCENGVNTGSASEQMQTCSVFGLMKLEMGDTVEIQRSRATVGINLDVDKTFFGLVQLSDIAVK